MCDRALVSYSLMAALNSTSLNLYNAVYVPLFKRILSKYGEERQQGLDVDIQSKFEEEYGFTIPIYTVRSLLKALEKGLSRKEKSETNFTTFSNGKSFQFSRFSFSDLEDLYKSEERKSDNLEKAFKEFCFDSETVKCNFAEFLHRNRKVLTNFFSAKADRELRLGDEFLFHVRFLAHIETNANELFQVAKNTYIGSIIAAALESNADLNTKAIAKSAYYLDTQIVLRSLDLQDGDETKPAQELIALLKKLNQDIRILDITLDEITHNLEVAIAEFNDNRSFHAIRTGSILHSCYRNNWSQTDLQRFLDRLESDPEKVTGLKVEKVPKLMVEKAKKSDDAHELRPGRSNPGSAVHDVAAYFYIRENRGGLLRNSAKAKAWFVSSNQHLACFNQKIVGQGHTPEIITPEELASLIWLRDPKKLDNDVSNLGLNSLIAHALHASLPKQRIINEVAGNISKYTDISAEDIALATLRLSEKTIRESKFAFDQLLSDEQTRKQLILELAEEKRSEIQLGVTRIAEVSNAAGTLETLNAKLAERIRAIELSLESSKITQDSIATKTTQQIENQARDLQLANEQILRIERQKWVLICLLLCIIGAGGSYYAYVSQINEYLRLSVYGCAILSVVASALKVISPDLLPRLFYGIAGLGGFWGFINVIINVLKALKIIS